jgi:hypothetical protein
VKEAFDITALAMALACAIPAAFVIGLEVGARLSRRRWIDRWNAGEISRLPINHKGAK